MEDKTRPSDFIEGTLAQRIQRNPDRARMIGGVYEFVLEGEGGGTWHVDLSRPEVAQGPAESMDCRIRMSAEDFVALAQGKLNEMVAFTQGRLKVEGDLTKAIKLRQLLSPQGW